MSAFGQEKKAMKMDGTDMKQEHSMQMMDDYASYASVQFRQLGEKFAALAKAMPAGTLDWRPADGIRSVREVLTHAPDANIRFLTMAGIKAPDGPMLPKDKMERENRFKTNDEIVTAINASFEYAAAQVASMEHDDLHAETTMFGSKTANMNVLLVSIGHLHEHLGQMIAYARVNGVTPPWSAGK